MIVPQKAKHKATPCIAFFSSNVFFAKRRMTGLSQLGEAKCF
jgi:hypothetical protein